MMDTPSKLSIIRKTVTLERYRTTLFLSCWVKVERRKWNWPQSVCGRWTPEVVKKRSVSRWTFVYYQSLKREVQTRPIHECRYDQKLKTKVEESTWLGYTGFLVELEHLKIKIIKDKDDESIMRVLKNLCLLWINKEFCAYYCLLLFKRCEY
jgi:hypothetical protein